MKYHFTLHVYEKEPSFGKGVIHLLKKVDEYQSLSKAYTSMHMSSSKAWKIINHAEKDLGFKLIESQVGGQKGGSSSLSEKGKLLVAQYEAFYQEIEQFADQKFKDYFKEF
ncbi:MAG: LysR family transcriptional regulator [Firmicutes bacterium]|nr:LysR family transcriptional regulator [Bacillota bacterium]